ncbi:hypothetical protein [uncultured Methanospirillum sp.]|uniref:hypothetical protein n=1 Tax=uncultured Methanospirillum sp. TaxID=262503 RepID=UPI0029C90331|nr:hypothetical protein [uncultured Methanospirillum sp.]
MEQRIREKAVRAISDILKSAGYDVHHASPPIDLSAVSGSTYLVVVCSDDQEEVSRFSETEYTVKGDQGEKVCEKLLVTFDPGIEVQDCIVWYAEEFARYAGEATLSRVIGRELLLPLGESGASVRSREYPDDPAGSGIKIPHLPVRVHREEAEDKAGVPGVATLKFLPYWLYRFTSRGSGSFKEQEVSFDGSGVGALNAINGSLIDVDPDTVTRRSIPQGSEVVRAQIDKEAADEKITGDLIRSMTRKVKARQIKGDAIYYEEKNVAPERSNIALELRELFIPVWQIKGKKIVEINAYTGERLREPMDDGVEVF